MALRMVHIVGYRNSLGYGELMWYESHIARDAAYALLDAGTLGTGYSTVRFDLFVPIDWLDHEITMSLELDDPQKQADQEIEALAACIDQRDPSDPVNR